MPRQRKQLGPGSVTSYKLPVVKGTEGDVFYRWLNRQSSLNGLITDALKVKFLIDTMKELDRTNKAPITLQLDTVESQEACISMDNIDIFEDENPSASGAGNVNIEGLKRMMDSISRR